MNSNIMNEKEFNTFIDELNKNLDNINHLYKQYAHWNSEYINSFRNNKGESISEIVFNHIIKNININ